MFDHGSGSEEDVRDHLVARPSFAGQLSRNLSGDLRWLQKIAVQ
jgi:hypothetical protein